MEVRFEEEEESRRYPEVPSWGPPSDLSRAELGALATRTARDGWRHRGASALAVEYLTARAYEPETHALDTAEKIQLQEGFDDLGDACDAITESL